MQALAEAGQRTLSVLEEVGAVFVMLGRVLRTLPRIFRDIHLTLDQMQRIGVESLPLVILTSVFTGGVAAIQAAYQFQNYVPLRYLGAVIGKSVVVELDWRQQWQPRKLG